MMRDNQPSDPIADETHDGVPAEASDGTLDSSALRAALGAYNVAPLSTPLSEAPVSTEPSVDHSAFEVLKHGGAERPEVIPPVGMLRLVEVSADLPAPANRTDEETDMSANPLYYVDLGPDEDLSQPAVLKPAPVGVDTVLGDGQIDEALERLRSTKATLSATLDRCAVAADHLAASAEIFSEAAVELQRVALERVAMEQSVTRAIDEIEQVRSAMEHDQMVAETQRAAMLAETTAAAEAMRAEAVADVERARERLLRFTSEISNVASELQGAFAPPAHKSA